MVEVILAHTALDTLLVLTHFIAAASPLSMTFDFMYSIQQMLDIIQDQCLVLKAHHRGGISLGFLLCWLSVVDDAIIYELYQIQDQTLEKQSESGQLKRHCRWLQQSAEISNDDLQEILVLFFVGCVGEQTV